mgnify:FL=1
MFDWLSNLLVDTAYDAAINSVGLASNNGMYQMEEPEILLNLVNEEK